MSNRLKLDFSIESDKDRVKFIEAYLPSLSNPTAEELETISNYIIWGKDLDKTFKSPRDQLIQSGILPPSKSSDWTSTTESLDQLMESPTFDETSLSPLTAPRIIIKKQKFSRAEALRTAPAFLRKTFEVLFREIDATDLKISLYEEEKRNQGEPRPELLARFTPEEIDSARLQIKAWTGHTYLKARHRLIQLRSEQYDLRDLYKKNVGSATNYLIPFFDSTLGLESGVEVLPLGICTYEPLLFFKELDLESYTEEDLQKISTKIWEKKGFKPSPLQFYFDFRNQDHVYTLLVLQREFSGEIGLEGDSNEALRALYSTLSYYIEKARLSEVQRKILDLKIRKVENYDIAKEVNQSFGKKYAPNYISTIFKQRIVKKICEAAELHLKVLENIFFNEEFKKCSCCGRTLLIDEAFFTRKKKSKDGFMNKCKECEKEKRTEKKQYE